MPAQIVHRTLRGGTTALALAATCAALAHAPSQTDLSKGNTLYVVPYAHLDTQWRWAYPQTIREFIANTLTRNFKLIDKYPHYVFNFSGSRRYEMMKEYYPQDYLRLKGYIQAGRWFPCGSSVDEGDANVPSGESIVRHVLYGNRYFRREFGVASQEFMLPDCFGFPYSLPSLLAHCGLKGFSTQKLTWGSAAGIPFKVGVWEGPDGRSVVAALDPGSYGGDVREDLSQNTSWLARIQKTGQISGAYVDYHYYGTGDTGGAPRESAVNWIEKSVTGSGPIKVVSAQADAMFTALTPGQIAKLPRYKGELLLTEHSAGSITSEAFMKRSNRKSELLADAAERASVAAQLLGGATYPSARLYNAWDLLLGSQMHDMLPGTSIPKAYEYCWNDFLLAQNQFSAIESDAVGAVAKQLNTSGKGVSIIVFNPLSIARQDTAEATIPDVAHGGPISVKGPDGKEVSAQILYRNGGTVHLAFAAKTPSAGFAVFSAFASKTKPKSSLKIDSRHVENARFRVTVNNGGDISSIIDKSTHKEILSGPSRLEMQYENPSQYPAWNMDWQDAKQPPRDVVDTPAKFRIVENGPARVSLEVEREKSGSKFVQQIRLTPTSDSVEVVNDINWKTRERALKASFPLTSSNPLATYDLQLGTTVRSNNNPRKYEVPQHQWFDLTARDGSYGAGILNDSKFASDKPSDGTVRLTLIYTPGVRAGFEDQATQDFGRHHIVYAIAPHKGDWRKGDIPWQGQRLNQPLRTFLVPKHQGSLGKTFSLVSTDSSQVEIQALKKAEDGNELIVRLRELHGATAKRVKIQFAKPVLAAREVTGQELPLGPAKVQNGALIATVPAYSLKSYAVKLGAGKSLVPTTTSKSLTLAYNADVISTDAHPADGQFAHGKALSAEQVPSTLTVDSVTFKLGPKTDHAKNAVIAQGQTLKIPAGYNRLYVLTAADGDTIGTFKLGKTATTKTIQNWNGFIGQWDNRHWAVDPGPDFQTYGDTMNGLAPGYVKPAEVAWFASHSHTPTGNTFYEYTYLYKVGFDIPFGAKTFTLPNNPRIKVLAVSVAKASHDDTVPAQPLCDTLTDHTSSDAPSVEPGSGSFKDATTVKIAPPLYFQAGSIHYTLDGSTPNASSPTYKAPFFVNDPVTIKVAEIDTHGRVGKIGVTKLDVHDTTPAHVVSANIARSLGVASITFSEPVSKSSAEATDNYKLSDGSTVTTASLGADHRTVELDLAVSEAKPTSVALTISGVQDLAHNPTTTLATVNLVDQKPVFTSPELAPKASRTFNSVENLPVHAGKPWTLNLFCKISQQPEDRTMIAGFGRSIDGRSGTGRYFTKFSEGINFWIANKDLGTSTPLDLGKWQMLTATYDGTTLRLYKNGQKIGEQVEQLEEDSSQVRVMPLDAWERKRRFDGEVQNLTIWDSALPASALKKLWEGGQH